MMEEEEVVTKKKKGTQPKPISDKFSFSFPNKTSSA